MSNRQPIGVFDSGVGGLSILRELKNALPEERFVFFADQAQVPYGEKTKEQLVALTYRIGKFLTDRGAKMIIVACNTATCYAIEELRKAFAAPIIGVVPAIKPAAEATRTNRIALIATPATAKSDFVTALIERFAQGIEVSRIGCAGLEDVVETGSLDSPQSLSLLVKYVASLKERRIDQLVLGCTHYPFLKTQIGALLGPGVALVDSGAAVARHAKAVLMEKNLESDAREGDDEYITNKDAETFSRVASRLLGHPVAGTRIAL